MGSNVVVDFILKLDNREFDSSLQGSVKAIKGFVASAIPLATGTKILSDLGKSATKMAIDFEQGFAKVSTLFGDVEVDTDSLKNMILELSDATGIASTELSEGLYSALSAGIPVTEDMGEAMSFLRDASHLAVAGFTSVDKAVDVSTSVLNAYGLETDQTARIMNTLIETQNAGKTTVDELASSIGKAIPSAAALGVNFEELSASLAVMTANGINTAESVTAMKALFAELSDTTSLANDAFKEMTGTTIPDFIAQGGSFQEVLATLNDYLKEQNKSWIDLFSSSEAVMAVQTLMKDDGEQLAEVYARLTDDTFELNEAYQKMQTPAQTIAQITEKMKNEYIRTGEAILEKFGPALEYLNEHMDKLAPAFVDATVKVGLFLVAIGGMFLINTIVGIVGTFTGSIITLGSAFLSTGALAVKFGSVMSSALETIAIKMLYVSDSATLAGQGISNMFSTISASATTSFSTIATNFSTMATSFTTSLTPALQAMSSQIGTFASTTVTQFSGMATGISGTFGSLGANFSAGLARGFGTTLASSSGFLTSLSGMFEIGFTAIAGFIGLPELAIAGLIAALIALAFNVGGVTDWLVEKFNWLADNWDEVLQRMIIGFGNFFIKLGEKAVIGLENLTVLLVNGLINLVTTLISTAVSLLVTGIEIIGSAVGGAVLTAFQSVALLVGQGFDLVIDVFRESLQFIKDMVVDAFNGIKEQIIIIWNSVINEFKIIWNSIKEIFSGFLKLIHGIVTLDFEEMKAGIIQIWNGIKSFFAETWENIKKLFGDSLLNIKETVKKIFGNIDEYIRDIWNSIKDFFSDIWEGIKNIFKEKINSIKSFVEEKFNSIKTFFSEICEEWKQTFSDSWDSIKENTASSVDAIKANAEEKFGDMSDSISDDMDRLNTYFSEKWETAKGIFDSATQSIYDNTVGRFKSLVDEVGRLMDKLQGKWNDTLGAIPGIPSFNRSEDRGIRGVRGANGYSANVGQARTIPKLSKSFDFKSLNFDKGNNLGLSKMKGFAQVVNNVKENNIDKVEIVSYAQDFDALMDEINENLGGLV